MIVIVKLKIFFNRHDVRRRAGLVYDCTSRPHRPIKAIVVEIILQVTVPRQIRIVGLTALESSHGERIFMEEFALHTQAA